MTVEAATPASQKLHINTYRTEDLKATSTIGIVKSEMTTVVLQLQILSQPVYLPL